MTYHRWPVFAAGSLLLTVTALKSFQESKDAKTLSVTYTRGILHASIPSVQGTGLLTVELLDPEDTVLGRVSRRVTASARQGAAWEENITLAKPMAMEDLVWQRLHYRFVVDGQSNPSAEGSESISQILRMPVVHILGQQSYFSGGKQRCG